MPVQLQFGADWLIVDGTRAAWGARLIVTQDGHVDMLHDRKGFHGNDADLKPLLDWLNAGALKDALDNLSRLLKERTVQTRTSLPIILYADRQGAILGDTRGSAGYCYIAGYLFEHLPPGHPTRGFEIVDKANTNETS